jgi:hypothetical protein
VKGGYEWKGQRISTGGTGLLEVLGTGAKISIWYPGARIPFSNEQQTDGGISIKER